jgi:hypothetical protein
VLTTAGENGLLTTECSSLRAPQLDGNCDAYSVVGVWKAVLPPHVDDERTLYWSATTYDRTGHKPRFKLYTSSTVGGTTSNSEPAAVDGAAGWYRISGTLTVSAAEAPVYLRLDAKTTDEKGGTTSCSITGFECHIEG